VSSHNHQAPLTEPGQRQVIAHSWRESDRFVPRTIVRPIQRIMQVETTAAIFVLAAAATALIIANTPLQEWYDHLWETEIVADIGGFHLLDLSVHDFINDGLMAIFFFVVAIEIKREWIFGELRDRKAAAMPIIAAIGGMVVPAIIYLVFNAGGEAQHGWGIPMATDIAFALAVLAAAGPRVPTSARVFLLTLAIVDDLGAILVIAIFYTGDLDLVMLGLAAATCVVVWGLQKAQVRSTAVFVLLGLTCWWFLHESGVHATIAGVAMGFLTIPWSHLPPKDYPHVARELVDVVDDRIRDGITHEEMGLNQGTLREIRRLTKETMSPLDRAEWQVAPWSAYVIVPIFAFANAGVRIPRTSPLEWLSDPIILGVMIGLVLGKTVGVFGAAWLAVRLGIARMQPGLEQIHLFGVAICAGVGFTVAIFVATLAFPDNPGQIEAAKLAIIVASIIAGVVGFIALRLSPDAPRGEAAEAVDRQAEPTSA
jgi:NhaA family Na+:H+ antiporter